MPDYHSCKAVGQLGEETHTGGSGRGVKNGHPADPARLSGGCPGRSTCAPGLGSRGRRGVHSGYFGTLCSIEAHAFANSNFFAVGLFSLWQPMHIFSIAAASLNSARPAACAFALSFMMAMFL